MPSQSEEWRGLLEKAEHDWLAAQIGLAHGARFTIHDLEELLGLLPRGE
jgi:hypothetical protein